MDTITKQEKTVLELLHEANGRVSPDQLVAGYKQKLGIRDGRTAGLTRMLELCLKSLYGKAYLRVDQGGERATPNRRLSGHKMRAPKTRLVPNSDTEVAQMKGRQTYTCAFFFITPRGKLAVDDPSLLV